MTHSIKCFMFLILLHYGSDIVWKNTLKQFTKLKQLKSSQSSDVEFITSGTWWRSGNLALLDIASHNQNTLMQYSPVYFWPNTKKTQKLSKLSSKFGLCCWSERLGEEKIRDKQWCRFMTESGCRAGGVSPAGGCRLHPASPTPQPPPRYCPQILQALDGILFIAEHKKKAERATKV